MKTSDKKSKHTREALTNEQLARLRAGDLARVKLTFDEKARLREINEARGRERAERTSRLLLEEGPILTDLRALGCDVKSVWDLVNSKLRYPEVIPVLLHHLTLPYSDRIREGVARSLAVPEPDVRRAWSTLVNEYRKAPTGWGIIAKGDKEEFRLGAKDGLACAIVASVTDERLPELIDLVRDKAQGQSRVLLLAPLRKSKSPHAKKAIAELAGDSDLADEIASWR